MKRWLIGGGLLLVLFAGLVTASALLPESPDRLPGSITNPRPNGVRALGQVLMRDGVDVTQVTTLDEATAAGADATLAVYLSTNLSDAALTRLRESPADLVVVIAGSVTGPSVDALSDHRFMTDYWWSEDDRASADCTDPDASAAGTLTPSDTGIFAEADTVITCFPDEEDVALYARVQTDHHLLTAIAGDRWLRNDTIATEGNAALALRVFGHSQKLVWYLPGADAQPTGVTDNTGLDLFSLLPPWVRVTFALLLVAGAAAALWRGRRFGRLVRELLPVEVPASEVSAGLARLYRQSSARGHAAAGLRAATVHRVAARLGLPASAPPGLVVDRLAQATGAAPSTVEALCYGPPPPTDTALVELATGLTDLERKLTARE
jgi:uncharacterized protein DUF4350